MITDFLDMLEFVLIELPRWILCRLAAALWGQIRRLFRCTGA